jgi:hypothetical protein
MREAPLKRLWKRGDLDLDSEHREARPDAPDELEGPVGKRAAPASRRRMTWVAAAVTALALVPVAVVGGFDELAGAAKGVAANQNPTKDQKQQPAPPPKEKQYAPNQVTICHLPGTADERTMTVPQSAVKVHLGHGDTTGACPTA